MSESAKSPRSGAQREGQQAEAGAIVISAGGHAFGDGNHPTTRMVLAALEALDPHTFAPRSACDMGCGSGLLALRVLQLFTSTQMVAVDVERSAVEATRANAAENGLSERILAVHSDGFRHPDIASHAPYDMILMNILAEPLIRLACDAEASLAPEGLLILSGILAWQEDAVREAYGSLGLTLLHRLSLHDWVCLVMEKPA
jgi:ribosomal protein L11 methyltransferase